MMVLDVGPAETITFDITGSVGAALLPVPLPGSAGLLLLAFGGIAMFRQKKFNFDFARRTRERGRHLG
jgi:hypothetical protein